MEKVSTVPTATELRYFRKEDESAANELADLLRQWGLLGSVKVKLMPGYESRTQLRQFEIWLARPDNGNIARLFQSLNAEAKDERLAAGQTLQSKYTSSPVAITEALAMFGPDRINDLSAAGRINVLYFLSRTSPRAWTPELERLGREVVARIEKAGSKLGDQTRAELKRFVTFLDTIGAGETTPQAEAAQ
jgi:hypothetical protein